MTSRRLTYGDVLLKGLGIEFKDCGCGCAPAARQVDPALASEIKQFERRQAWIECCKERDGALAWDVAECGYRWLTNGQVQEGPIVKFVPPDGRRAGYYLPGEGDTIYLARGLSTAELIQTAAHEASHAWFCWDPSEETARLYGSWIARRYLQKFDA